MYRLPTRAAARIALALGFLLSTVSAGPAAAVSPSVTLTTQASPLEVTVDLPIAYMVSIYNGSNNALKNVRITGQPSIALAPLGAEPAANCLDGVCTLNGLPSGETRAVTFYYLAPASPQSFTFTALANFDGQTTSSPASYQNTTADPVTTQVLDLNQDLVKGHAFGEYRTFTTGMGPLGATNRHGTEVFLTDTAEVMVRDLSVRAADAYANCQVLLGAPCFGEASELSVKGGEPVSGGLRVTIRWDSSDLPKGMTEKKIRIVHFLDGGVAAEPVTRLCGAVTPAPCLAGPVVRLADRDIQAVVILPSNGVIRGW